MKYLIGILTVGICLLFSFGQIFAECTYNGGSIGTELDNCLSGSDLVDATGNMNIGDGVKDKITGWTQALAGFFGLLAVGAIVYGGFLMTISGGQDEKIKKGKDIIKWSLLGFLLLVFTGAIIRIIVEFIFSIAS